MPFKVINSNTTTQLKVGPGKLWNIIVSDPGSAWVMAVKDGPDSSGNFQTLINAAKISAGQPFTDAAHEIAFRDGLQVVTSGTTAGELDFQFD